MSPPNGWGTRSIPRGLCRRPGRCTRSAGSVRSAALLVLFCGTAAAELDRIEIRSVAESGPYERILGRAHYSVDPTLAANQGIADIALAPRNSAGRVEFSGDVLVWR